MHIHLIGVCGTGMGALAGLLKAAGHRVTGSDASFAPPMGPALKRWGIEVMEGFSAENLRPAPDLVVVGNVCRPNHVEARAAIDGGLAYTSFPALMEREFLQDRQSLVIAGTHGKTTSSSLLAFLLREAQKDPGFLVGGIPRDFDVSFRVGHAGGPFVIEGDEYDCAFFEKKPKFWRYNPHAVLLTSVEHDHIDIYPDEASYLAAFSGLIERIPADGLLVAYAGDPHVRALAAQAKCRVRYYALDGDDCGDQVPIWSGAIAPPVGGATPIDLFGGGSPLGRVMSPLAGRHNARNLLGVLAMATEGAGADLSTLLDAVPRFSGVKRRQELLAIAGGVRVIEDFAHHPSAVQETLAGLRQLHGEGKLLAAFEPRSATASRRLHQQAYGVVFDSADGVVLAPVGRPEISTDERLDTTSLAERISSDSTWAVAADSLNQVRDTIVSQADPGDTVVLMSNGAFGGIYDDIIASLATRDLSEK